MKTKKIKTERAMRRRSDAGQKQSVVNIQPSIEKTFGGVKRFLTLAFLLSLTFACTPRSFEKPNVAATPAAVEDKQANFRNEVEKMRTANLQYIFVFRRKDGGAFESDDKRFLRANLPFNNRVVLADEEKAVIVGSNYKFPPENLDALRARFNIEDYSSPEPAK